MEKEDESGKEELTLAAKEGQASVLPVIEFRNVGFCYEGSDAPVLQGINLTLHPGENLALVGLNGAGKTTTLHTVTGLISPKSGQVLFEGKDITKTPAHKIVSMGMAHVPEGRRVFAELSVYENLRMGAYTRKDKAEIEETLKKCL